MIAAIRLCVSTCGFTGVWFAQYLHTCLRERVRSPPKNRKINTFGKKIREPFSLTFLFFPVAEKRFSCEIFLEGWRAREDGGSFPIKLLSIELIKHDAMHSLTPPPAPTACTNSIPTHVFEGKIEIDFLVFALTPTTTTHAQGWMQVIIQLVVAEQLRWIDFGAKTFNVNCQPQKPIRWSFLLPLSRTLKTDEMEKNLGREGNFYETFFFSCGKFFFLTCTYDVFSSCKKKIRWLILVEKSNVKKKFFLLNNLRHLG